jgi:hypothetical protein
VVNDNAEVFYSFRATRIKRGMLADPRALNLLPVPQSLPDDHNPHYLVSTIIHALIGASARRRYVRNRHVAVRNQA